MNKTIGLDCNACGGAFAVRPERARRSECPNCHSDNVEILDEVDGE